MSSRSVLTDDLLERCARRAAGYDRENRFFFEDFDELREAKYLLAAVPEDFGGLGLTLLELCREQRRLARRSAPTALGINMHLLATGTAADLWRRGDESQVWILEEAARGAVFAQGYSESGNDLEALYSASKAERVDGGYRFFGRKHFGTLSPVRTWLNLSGTETADPGGPKIVHAVMPRGTTGTISRTSGTRSACGRPRARTRSSKARSCRTAVSSAPECPALRAPTSLF